MNQETTARLPEDIDQVAINATNQIESFERRRWIRSRLPSSLWMLIVVPLFAVVLQCWRWMTGQPAGTFFSWTTLIVASCGLPLAWLLGRLAMRQMSVSRERAIRAADKQLGASDRILTADEFLKNGTQDGFQQAAVEDAADWALRGRTTTLEQTGTRGPSLRYAMLAVPVSIAALWLAYFLTQFDSTGFAELDADVASVQGAEDGSDEAARSERKSPVAPQPQLPPPERPEAPQVPGSQRAVNRQGSANSAIPDRSEESRGKLNEGETRESQQSANPSSARGAPSASGQPSKSGDETKRKPKKKQKKTNEKEREKKERKQDDKPSGATAGQGSSKGSDNNAAPSDWASLSQASTPDDEDIEEEDEVDDEEEEQESRGGVQPNMRDRRTPVNRDLQIGFGTNRPNPDANGRGGPGGQKKSRGVASLVLGVPIPDRVNGQPNKGRIRITQQRITPEAEQADPVAAQDRSPREGTVGPIHHPTFSPWLQDFVRRYFLERRAKHPLRTGSDKSALSPTSQDSLQTTRVAESDTPPS